MTPISNYKTFLTAFIQRHMAILGPNIALDTALQVTGLTINATGEVMDISGDSLLVLHDVISGYRLLSVPVTMLIFAQLLEQYPMIKADYKDPLPVTHLTCAFMAGKGKA